MSCKTPVVLIVFRRPDLTAQVFDRIREAQPPKLFVVADGARSPEEQEACNLTRAVTEQVDWPCEVVRDYSDENRGARRRISSGLDGVFGQVERAIILEDDCLPDPSFFNYCDELLERYQDDDRVFSISGDNLQRGQVRGEASYFFSNYFHGWGWATWRRVWKNYDHEMEGWPAFRNQRLEDFFSDPVEQTYWRGFLDGLKETGVPDAWDYIWMLTGWMHGGLTIQPNVNLVENIGFGADATNTVKTDGWIANRPAEPIRTLTHPVEIAVDPHADRFIFDSVFPGNRLRRERNPGYRLKRWGWRMKNRLRGRTVVK